MRGSCSTPTESTRPSHPQLNWRFRSMIRSEHLLRPRRHAVGEPAAPSLAHEGELLHAHRVDPPLAPPAELEVSIDDPIGASSASPPPRRRRASCTEPCP